MAASYTTPGDATLMHAVQGFLTNLLLPPLGLVLLVVVAGLLAVPRAPLAGWMTTLAATALLVLSTPFAAGQLRAGLGYPTRKAGSPGAIVVLGAEQRRTLTGTEIGPLSLERTRVAAALARHTGLPLLVTGGKLAAGTPPIAELIAESLVVDFATAVRWIEPRSTDTRQNAEFSAAVLQREGVYSIYLVSHEWHLPRATVAFERAGLAVLPAPVRREPAPDGRASDFLPRADHLAASWFMLREWAGILVYRLRDGPVPQRQ